MSMKSVQKNAALLSTSSGIVYKGPVPLRYKKMHPGAITPRYAHRADACIDPPVKIFVNKRNECGHVSGIFSGVVILSAMMVLALSVLII